MDAGKEELKSWLKNMTGDPRCCKWFSSETKDLQNELKGRLDNWHGLVAVAIQNFSYNGKSADDRHAQWNFPSTLLFVVTLITTIGYYLVILGSLIQYRAHCMQCNTIPSRFKLFVACIYEF